MLAFLKKKNNEELSKPEEKETENSSDLKEETVKEPENNQIAPIEEFSQKDGKPKEKDKSKEEKKEDVFQSFGALLNIPAKEVEDECCLFAARKFMAKTGKVIVRYDITEAEILKTIKNCMELSVSEILASPAYLSACAKIIKRHGLYDQKICAFIDFPFGESSFQSKLADVKAAAKLGVDGFTVVMPTVMLQDSRIKEFKTQIKKLGKITKKPVSIALSVAEMDKEEINFVIKTAGKTNVNSITFIFGQATESEIREKTEIIKKCKTDKEIRILGNVESAAAVAAITMLGADKVFSPYADEIGKEVVQKFSIKSAKLC